MRRKALRPPGRRRSSSSAAVRSGKRGATPGTSTLTVLVVVEAALLLGIASYRHGFVHVPPPSVRPMASEMADDSNATKPTTKLLRMRCRSYKEESNASEDRRPAPCYGDKQHTTEYAQALFEDAGFEVTDGDTWDLLWNSRPQRQYVPFERRFDPDLFGRGAVRDPDAPLRLWCDKRGQGGGGFFPGAGDKCALAPYLRQLHDASHLSLYMEGTDVFHLPGGADGLAGAMRDHDRRLGGGGADGKSGGGGTVWILKPCVKSHGRGQHLTTMADAEGRGNSNLTAAPSPGRFVAQPYVGSPALLDGKKFHLRIYVLVTDWAPVEENGSARALPPRAYIAREGLLKVASVPFVNVRFTGADLDGLSPKEREDLLAKHNSYHVDESIPNRRMSSYLDSLDSEVRAEVWNTIASDVGRLMGCAASRSGAYVPEAYGRCFDFFGLDVIFSETEANQFDKSRPRLRPQLMEVNLGPMMGALPGDDDELAVKAGILGRLAAWAAGELNSTEPLRGSATRVAAEGRTLLPEFERLPTAVDERAVCGTPRKDRPGKLDLRRKHSKIT